MTEKMIKFLEAADKDAALAEKLKAAETLEAVAALAKEYGFTFTDEDLKVELPTGELDDEALEDVAGGVFVAGSTVAGSTVAGSTVAGSTVAGSAVAGSSVAGSAVAGSSVAGSAVAGSTVAGSSVEVYKTLGSLLLGKRKDLRSNLF